MGKKKKKAEAAFANYFQSVTCFLPHRRLIMVLTGEQGFYTHSIIETTHSCDMSCFPFSRTALMHATMHQLAAPLD